MRRIVELFEAARKARREKIEAKKKESRGTKTPEEINKKVVIISKNDKDEKVVTTLVTKNGETKVVTVTQPKK